MDKQTAIKLAGSSKKLAELLGITKGAVTNWKENKIPKGRVFQLMVMKPDWFKGAT
jgi:DNA-binding transcriptional regulator YdaS (Cro superfamily)